MSSQISGRRYSRGHHPGRQLDSRARPSSDSRTTALPGLWCATGDPLNERPNMRLKLPAAFGAYTRVDNTVVFELPDSGGYLANGTPIDRARIPSVLHEVLAPRDSVMRAVFIIDNPHRSWADIDYIRASAAAAGGQAFDAERSSRLPIKGWRVVRSDSAR